MPRSSQAPAIYSQRWRLAPPEEAAAFEAGLPLPSVQAERDARRAASNPGILRALAVGASHLFTQYRMASQLSPAIAAAKLAGGKYSCSRELSLIDGECVGVRVTRTS
jgi:hypothetical protein